MDLQSVPHLVSALTAMHLVSEPPMEMRLRPDLRLVRCSPMDLQSVPHLVSALTAIHLVSEPPMATHLNPALPTVLHSQTDLQSVRCLPPDFLPVSEPPTEMHLRSDLPTVPHSVSAEVLRSLQIHTVHGNFHPHPGLPVLFAHLSSHTAAYFYGKLRQPALDPP